MEPRKIKMLLHDDMVHQILQWLPVISLFRFKLVCRTWRALIESSYFIKQHLHLHHYDPNLKDKNYNLIFLLQGMGSPITFALTSTESFEEPNIRLQLNYSGYFPIKVYNIVSYNGIICLNILNRDNEQSIFLWNPATKQSRVLPQSPALNRLLALNKVSITTVGFGFDVKSDDYKVVNLIRGSCREEKRAEVYSLNTGSWRSVTTDFPSIAFKENSRMPFNNGTCFLWLGHSSGENTGIVCFDFCFEMFRSISFPYADYFPFHYITHVSVVLDKIACVFTSDGWKIEVWVFNEYGTVNESWTKLYTVDTCAIIDRALRIDGVSMNGDCIFVVRGDLMCKFNVVTKEANCFALEKTRYTFDKNMVEYKESLVLILGA